MLLLQVFRRVEGMDILIKLEADGLAEGKTIFLGCNDDEIVAADVSEEIAA